MYPLSGGLASGSDGNIWVGQYRQILKVSPADGQILDTYPLSGGAGDPIPGPDGRLWFDFSDGKIGAITTSGELTTYDVPGSCYGPVRGPGQTIWLR